MKITNRFFYILLTISVATTAAASSLSNNERSFLLLSNLSSALTGATLALLNPRGDDEFKL
jgi:hypothetical protein